MTGVSGERDVLGLHLIRHGAPDDPVTARVRAQLRAADAMLTRETQPDEPEAVRALRRKGEALLRASRYEEAQETFLESIDLGLRGDYFSWHAAVNLINCHRFLGRLDEADATAAALGTMYAEQPHHPLGYLLATQRGAIAADRFEEGGDPADAAAALEFARAAYRWQADHRGGADGLRAYNLVVALLRVGGDDEARTIYHQHEHDDVFQDWCAQGKEAQHIAVLAGH